MAERKVTEDATGDVDDQLPLTSDVVRPEPPGLDDLPPDLDESAPDDFGATDPADLDQATLGGDSDGLDAGLDTDLGDRTERMGDLGDRDPVGDMAMPTEIPGAPAAGSPEEARDAGRDAAGSDTGGMSTETDPTPYPDTSGNPSSSDEKVTLDSSPADGGIPSSSGDDGGTLKGLVGSSNMDKAAEYTKAHSKVQAEGKDVPQVLDVMKQNTESAESPSGVHVAPSQAKVIVFGNPGGPEGQEGGPPIPIPGGWDPDDVVDGSNNDLQGDGGYTDPADDPVGAQMEGGPVVDDSIRYHVDPEAVPTDPSMLPETLSGEGGDIDPVEF